MMFGGGVGWAAGLLASSGAPARVAREARAMGLQPGFALDMRAVRPDVEPWDFTKAEHREEARWMVKTER